MKKITFVIPSRNNLEFLQLAYKSIKNLKGDHDILVLNDASTDNTQDWIESLGDDNLITYNNPGPERIGIVGMFDKGIEMAKTDIIMAFHADMVASPNLDEAVLKHLKPKTVVTATRVEPPLHPDGKEKVVHDFGSEIEDFDYNKFCDWTSKYEPKHGIPTTEGVFAPWCMYKEDFLSIGGHDELFAPQSREDSDLFNRFILNGYKTIQTWEGLVYHFTSRGSRFNKHNGVKTGQDSEEWKKTNSKNERNFFRKWGSDVCNDEFLKPIVLPKYDIGIILYGANLEFIELLEPRCSNLYYDICVDDIQPYLDKEQKNTLYDLKDRVKSITEKIDNEIIIEINCSLFNNNDFAIINNFSKIMKENSQTGTFKLENMIIKVSSFKEYQDLLK